MAWSASGDGRPHAGCKCKEGWRGATCATEESYGAVRLLIANGWDFGGLDEEEELQLKGKAKSKVGWSGDPFCKVTVNGMTTQTAIDSSTYSPTWNKYSSYSSPLVTKNAKVDIECWDYDRVSANDLYGKNSFFIQNDRMSNWQYYTVRLYQGESDAKRNGKWPKVKVAVYVQPKYRDGSSNKVKMDTSWLTINRKTYPRPKGAGSDCIVTAMSGDDLDGEQLQVTNVPRCKTMSITYNTKVATSVSSFKLNDSCEKVMLWDEDKCKPNYEDNRIIRKSAGYGRRRRRFDSTLGGKKGGPYDEVNWDLNDDVCAITVTGKC